MDNTVNYRINRTINTTQKLGALLNKLTTSSVKTTNPNIIQTDLASSWMEQFVTPNYDYIQSDQSIKLDSEDTVNNNANISNHKTNNIKTKEINDELNIRKDFPLITSSTSLDNFLVWFDNGATTQKPQIVIDKVKEFYETYNSNIHRGSHKLADMTTEE